LTIRLDGGHLLDVAKRLGRGFAEHREAELRCPSPAPGARRFQYRCRRRPGRASRRQPRRRRSPSSRQHPERFGPFDHRPHGHVLPGTSSPRSEPRRFRGETGRWPQPMSPTTGEGTGVSARRFTGSLRGRCLRGELARELADAGGSRLEEITRAPCNLP
jgi:hypothetical protein